MTQANDILPPDVPEHTLLRQIGQGAYGDVWLARNALGTYRAVKIIYRSRFDHARPFERELRGIREVEPFTRQHEGLVDILQVGERDDSFYYIMELADDIGGEPELEPETYQPRTLTMELYKRERLPVESASAIGATIAGALAFLHEHKLVHRDVKLSNIIYVNGRVKLADVGLVTRSDASFSLVGTYGYIPREGPGRPPADIYALGKVLYELATGKDRADFPEIDILDPALKGLNQIFLKACAEEARDRYADAGDMKKELEKLTVNDAATTPPFSAYKIGALATIFILILGLMMFQRTGGSGEGGKDEQKNPASDPRKPNSTSTARTQFDFTKSLVAYYPFNGNANDESDNGNDGTVKGPHLVADRHGKASSAYKFIKDGPFDTGQHIWLPNDVFGQGEALTINVWVKPSREGFIANWPRFVGGNLAGSESQNIHLGFLRGQNHLYADVETRKEDGTGAAAELTGKEPPVAWNEWTMATLVYDGKELTAYHNGKRNVSKPITGRLQPLGIVTIGGTTHHFTFGGALDDVRIYHRALTVAEVKALYDLEKPKK